MKTDVLLLILIVSIVTGSRADSIPDEHEVHSCERPSLQQCIGLNYSTIFPNNNDLSIFDRMDIVFNSGCSKYSVELACYMLQPICQVHYFPGNFTEPMVFAAHPCKEFCLFVKHQCREHVAWWHLDCNSLPNVTTRLCFMPGNITTDPPPTAGQANGSNVTGNPTSPETTRPPVSCPGRLVPYKGKSFGSVDDCTAPCHHYYEEDELSPGVITALYIVWSVLAVLSGVSFVSFVLTWKHYSHIEYPYYWAYLCHALFIVAFFIRAAVGHDDIVCDTEQSTNNDTALCTEKIGNGWCAVTFMITYYATLAIAIWFLNMSIALCTLKYFSKRYYLHFSYHAAGWGIPIIFVGLACALNLSSGDSLLGMCQPDPRHTVAILIVPLMSCAFLGCFLLFVSIFQIFCCSRASRELQYRHPYMVWRALFFGAILLIEIGILSALHLIEHVKYEDWELYYTDCVVKSPPESDCSSRSFTRPTYVIPIMKYTLISVVGALSVICPLSRKVTWLSWKESLLLLYKKIVDLFGGCSWRRKTVVRAQLETSL